MKILAWQVLKTQVLLRGLLLYSPSPSCNLLPNYGYLLEVSLVERFLRPIYVLVFLLCALDTFGAFVLLSKDQESGLLLRLPCWDVQMRVRISPCVCVGRVNISCISVCAARANQLCFHLRRKHKGKQKSAYFTCENGPDANISVGTT